MKKRGHMCSLRFFRSAQKRGQLTIFILIALIIFLVIVFYFWLAKPYFDSTIHSEIRPVYDIVFDCVDSVSLNAIYDVSESGGYFQVPEKSNYMGFPYYFYEDEGFLAELKEIEDSIQKYIESVLPFCVSKAVSGLEEYELSFSKPDAKVKIKDDDNVYVTVDFPFSVLKDDRVFYFDQDFDLVFDIRLHSIYYLASNIVEWLNEEPRALCVNCISDLSFFLGLYTITNNDFDGGIVFMIKDGENIKYEDYSFFFVIKTKKEEFYDPFEGMFEKL